MCTLFAPKLLLSCALFFGIINVKNINVYLTAARLSSQIHREHQHPAANSGAIFYDARHNPYHSSLGLPHQPGQHQPGPELQSPLTNCIWTFFW